jgi:nucleotide-binding universal stress UspA family protein
VREGVLVAYDGSGPAAAGADLAFQIAAGCNSPVTLVHVLDPKHESSSSGPWAAKLDMLANTAPTSVAVEQRLLVGDVRQQLLAALESSGADTIVAGTQGLGTVRRMMPGGVSRWLFECAPCPVLLTRERAPTHPLPQVLVGVDDSESSLALLDVAQEVAAALFACLILVHVADPHVPPFGAADAYTGVRDALRRHGDEVLHDAHERITAPIEAIQSELREGHPRDELVAACQEHDPTLAVIGIGSTRGLHGLRSGSNACEIVNRVGCPVLTVRPTKSHGGGETATRDTPGRAPRESRRTGS